MTHTTTRLALFAALVVTGAVGCSSAPPPRTEDPDTTNLRRIYQAFVLCQTYKTRGPASEDELKRWLSELGEPGTPDEFVVSRRDGKPFVVFYGQTIDRAAGEVILAYEQDGADGKRFVLTLGADIRAFSDEEFARAQFAGKRPAKARG